MRVSVTTTGDFSSTIKRLQKMSKGINKRVLSRIEKKGTASLAKYTPVGETGQTAMGWSGIVTDNEIQWVNNAHPNESVNVAKIIQFGHGTGTGGYVPPFNYIPPALESVFGEAADIIVKEVFD